ncbi:hypothetical protein MXD81_01805 [Microbacteriaceae bacterium K1510]|nr:hypothetical protein [Microbacteriaceae bacterium K1510]
MRVRIVAVPPGEAPQWVREQWIGCELPLIGRTSGGTFRTVGILKVSSFWRHFWETFFGKSEMVDGYMVDVAAAVRVLEVKSPEAAAWWREHAPYLMRRGRFIFHREACTLVDG